MVSNTKRCISTHAHKLVFNYQYVYFHTPKHFQCFDIRLVQPLYQHRAVHQAYTQDRDYILEVKPQIHVTTYF